MSDITAIQNLDLLQYVAEHCRYNRERKRVRERDSDCWRQLRAVQNHPP